MKVSVFCALRCVFFAGFEGKRGAARGKKHWFFPLVLLGQMRAAGRTRGPRFPSGKSELQ